MVQSSIPDLSVVLPAYLEEENLRILLPRIKSTLESMQVRYQIVVVDTQKPMDSTDEVCRSLGVTYLNRTGSNSFGSAVRTGIEAASGARTIFMDADGSHGPEFITQLYAKRGEADIVIASRYIAGGMTENTRSLALMSIVLNWTYSVVLGLKCKDVSNSFKLYVTSQLKELELQCENFDIVEEIIYKIRVLNPTMKILEIPFTFKKRMFGETKRNLVQFIVTYAITIVRLKLMRVRKKAIR